jgi:hypothetical protein
MNATRRDFLTGAGVAAMGGLAAACTTNPSTGQLELNPSVVDAIQQGVAAAAQYIPDVESIVSTAVGFFGPQYAAIVTLGSTAINTLINALSSVVTSLTPAASARLRTRLGASSPINRVVIGTITKAPGGGAVPTPITVTGYHI